MKIIRLLFGLLAALLAALLGNWVGGQIRFMRNGETIAAIHYTHTTASGLRMDNYPVNTKFFPALQFALFSKPRWLFAFMGGILTSLWIDDNYEAIFMERLIVPLIVNPALRENLEPETDTLLPE